MSLKSRLTRILNDTYLKKKLFILYAVCGLLPVFLLSILLLTDTQERLLTLSDSQLQADNQANRSILMSATNLVSAVSKILVSDEALLHIIETDYKNDASVYADYRNYTLLDDFTNNYAEIADIRLYINNPTLVSSNRYQTLSIDTMASDWYKSVMKDSSEVVWIYGNFSQDAHLYLLRRIILPHTDRYAILVIGISNNYLSSMNYNRLQTTCISLDKGPVVFSNDSDRVGSPLEITLKNDYSDYMSSLYKFEGQNVLACESTLKGVSSPQTFRITTINHDYGQITSTLLLITAITLIVSLLPMLIFFAFSHNYSGRLLTIRELMHQISKGHLEIEKDFIGEDELGELFQDMQATINGIQELNLLVLKEQKEKGEIRLQQQKMQFELLANQINPHFLFNTLETIRMRALLANQTELNDIILKLGRTLRYALDTSSTSTTLENALEYLESYLEIQHFRFQDKLNYSIDIQPDIDTKNTIILPFILQPIVENAIMHGFEKKKKGGKITIRVTLDKDLIVSVTDNGCGIPADRLAELNEKLAFRRDEISSTHIGMHNANDRIKLSYGDEYGISLTSTPGEGTTATIKLPHNEV